MMQVATARGWFSLRKWGFKSPFSIMWSYAIHFLSKRQFCILKIFGFWFISVYSKVIAIQPMIQDEGSVLIVFKTALHFFNSVSFPYFSHKLHFVCNFSVLQTMAGYWAEIFFELSTVTIGSFSWEIIANFKTSSIWKNSSKFSFEYEWKGFFPKD